jgi:NADH:ubiquinone oxidoreductase subunit F (NADH-binding)
MDDLFKAMRLTSICGLGQIIHAPVASVIKHFPTVIDEHLNGRRCSAGACFATGA